MVEQVKASVFILLTTTWQPRTWDDTTAFVNRQFAIQLRGAGHAVYVVTMKASSDLEIKDAKQHLVKLIGPTKNLQKINSFPEKDVMLLFETFYDTGILQLNNKPNTDLYVVGHANTDNLDTCDATVSMVDDHLDTARLIMFMHFVPSKEYGTYDSDSGKKDIEDYQDDACLVIAVGPALQSYYGDKALCYIPIPTKPFFDINVSEPEEGSQINVLTVGYIGIHTEQLKIIATAMNNVACTSNCERLTLNIITNRCTKELGSELSSFCTEKSLKHLKFSLLNCSDKETMTEHFRRSALVVDTDTRPTMSLTILHAMAVGLPVLFHKKSGVGVYTKKEHPKYFDVFDTAITVDTVPREGIKKAAQVWADAIGRMLETRHTSFVRAGMVKDGLRQSVCDGKPMTWHAEILHRL